MEKQAYLFLDDTLNGISLSIQNLQHQETEARVTNQNVHHVITKYNPHFRNLINFLDLSFSFGLKDAKKGYWPFVKKMAHTSVIAMVEEHKFATTEVKKGYIWLFLTFIENSLEGYIRMMVGSLKMLKLFYKEYALLRNTERCEILLNLLVGIETFSFSINFDEPYLDFGHDPVLRQEKIIIRVPPPLLKTSVDTEKQQPLLQQLQQPDVTIHPQGTKRYKYPDLLEAQRNLFSKTPEGSPLRHSMSVGSSEMDMDMDLVQHVKRKSKKGRTASEGDEPEVAEEESGMGSIEMEEDNFIPEFVGSPEYALCIAEESNALFDTSSPVLQSLSESDIGYQKFLECYANEDKIANESMGNNTRTEVKFSENEEITAGDQGCDDDLVSEPIANKIERLSMGESDGYCFTHVSDDESDSWIGRSDSFDKFCRKEISVSLSPEDVSPLSVNDHSVSVVEVSPAVPHVFASPSLSESSASRLNSARHDTGTGYLLPTLPRRPNLKEAMQRSEEIILDQSAKLLLSLEVFNHPTELPVKMFEVSVGLLVGLNYVIRMLISTHTLYLLKQKDTIQCFICIMSVDIDSINKVQTGLNFQEIYIVHDGGCFHVSTADEVVTRSILLTIKSAIKSDKEANLIKEHPMAANTNNDLDLIIQDWLICHTRVEDPHIFHFALMQFSVLSSIDDRKNEVLKAGYVSCRQYILGVKKTWEKAFLSLRGHILYQYSSQGNEIKNKYDIKTKCGGCIHSGSDGSHYMFKILAVDGSSTLVEIGVDNENEANDWLMTICQVVADTKNEGDGMQSVPGVLMSCGLVLTYNMIYFFNQDPKSGRLSLEEAFAVADITQVCVDNENRSYCTIVVDYYVEHSSQDEKMYWLLDFKSEYELGKFEEKLCECWQSMYQVPLQFVLLTDESMKRRIEPVLRNRLKGTKDIDRNLFIDIISN